MYVYPNSNSGINSTTSNFYLTKMKVKISFQLATKFQRLRWVWFDNYNNAISVKGPLITYTLNKMEATIIF